MKKYITIISIALFTLINVQNTEAQEGFLGEIRIFAGNFPPRNWAFCDGQILPINQNQSLFSILGTTYGGDGRTTFALPDFRGRAPMHAGQGAGLSNRTEGQKSGSETNILTIPQMAAHSHTPIIGVTSVIGTQSLNGIIASHTNAFATLPTANQYLPDGNIGSSGNGQPINNMQPFQVVSYIICINGTFPSRN